MAGLQRLQASLAAAVRKAEAGLRFHEAAEASRLLQRLGRNQGLATLQQLTAARGGTLGITSVTPIEGLQANIDAQLFGQNANIYTQFGGLTISKNLGAEAFAESMQEDLPRVRFGAVPRMELPTTRLSTAGMRIRLALRSLPRVSRLQSQPCLSALRRFERDSDIEAAADVSSYCKTDEIVGTSGTALSFGVRLIQRSALEDGREPTLGGAAELMYSYDRSRENHTHRVFIGGSVLRVNGSDDMLGNEGVEYPRFQSGRITAGYEICGARTAQEQDLLPRAGIYGVVSWGRWHNPYTNGTSDAAIRGTALEAGFYLGGRFQKNFQGLIAARVLKPMDSDELTFILSLVPGGSTASAGGS